MGRRVTKKLNLIFTEISTFNIRSISLLPIRVGLILFLMEMSPQQPENTTDAPIVDFCADINVVFFVCLFVYFVSVVNSSFCPGETKKSSL